MVWSIRATRHPLFEIGIRPKLVEQLDAIPSKSLARLHLFPITGISPISVD